VHRGKILRPGLQFGPASDRRALIRLPLRRAEPFAPVLVAAILVASDWLHRLDAPLR
jgi:hypothetical protein